MPEAHFNRDSIESAFSSLLDVIDAKSKSNEVIRQRMTDENATLRDKISARAALTNEELKIARQKMLENDHAARVRHQKMDRKINKLRTRLQQEEAGRDDLEDENRAIKLSIGKKEGEAKELMEKARDLERHASVAEHRLKDLKRQAERYRSENEGKDREIGTRRAAQRFGVADIADHELLELRRLEGEAARLIQENEALALELKKRRLLAGNVELTEVSSISGI
jgi:hypothetical protein